MRRRLFVLVLVLLVGGLPLWSAQASSTHPTVHSSVLLVQATPASSGIFSGFVAAIEKFVDSVVQAVSSLFVGRPADRRDEVRKPAAIAKAGAPREPGSMAVTAPVKPVVPIAPLSPKMLQAVVPTPPSSAEDALPDELREEGMTAAKPVVSTGVASVPTVRAGSGNKAVANVPSRDASKASDKAAAKSSSKDTLKLSKVDSSPKTAASSVVPSASTTPIAGATPAPPAAGTPAAAAPVATPVPTSSAAVDRPVAEPRSAPASPGDTRTPAASSPMLYAQPFAAPVVSRPAVAEPVTRPVAVETPVARVETRPAPRVEEAPRFIDAYLPPPRVEEEPVRREAVVEERIVAAEEPPAVAEAPRTEVREETPPEVAPTPEPAPDLRSSTFIISDGVQPLVIQAGARTTSIIDPATTEAVVCRTANESSILTLGEDDAGVTRGVVLNGGILLFKPADFFRKFLRLEGAPFAIDAVAKDCDFVAHLARLSTPEFIIPMPKLSETERELIPANIVVGTGGRIFIVAADNTAEKTLRGIAVREAGTSMTDSRTLFKPFPERNQLPLVVRGVTAVGELTGRIIVDLVLTDRDGMTTTQRCEFARDVPMTCTEQATIQR